MLKRILTRGISPGAFVRSLRVIVVVAILCVAPAAAAEVQTFYTTSGAGNDLPNGAEVFAIEVSGSTITTRDVGPTHGGDCASLALSPSGTLYSMCGPLLKIQRLATIDLKTGRAHLFGVGVPGLAVMAMTFAPDGILYAVGDCHPDKNSECTRDSDPNYNSLYKVNVQTGAFTRVGPTGAPQFFMDLAFDHNGNMFGVTTTNNPLYGTCHSVPHRPCDRKGHEDRQSRGK